MKNQDIINVRKGATIINQFLEFIAINILKSDTMEKEKSTQIIYDSFDTFKEFLAQEINFEQWEHKLEHYWNILKTDGKREDSDYLLCECILRMFFRGSVEIQHKRYEWKPAQITVSFNGKEYKTEIPIYDFGVFKNSPLSDNFWRGMIYSKLTDECSKVYDKFMPDAWSK